jgi:ferredoxin
MRGVIFYYSGTGNTALACRYLARRLPAAFELIDVTKARDAGAGSFDMAGFATSTEFWGVPRVLETFIESLPQQDGVPAFALNTFGGASGKAQLILAEEVAAKGFRVLAGHSLRMPENYPPMIAGGMGAPNAPGPKEMAALDSFVSEVASLASDVREGGRVEGRKLKVGFVNSLLPRRSRTTARDDMGPKSVDASACTECGQCARECPYGAIRLDPKPVFDMSACHGCWRCYNRCPEHAIYTRKFHGGPFYPRPDDALRGKLGVAPGDAGA